MIVKLLRTYTNLETLAELLIINTYINSKPWASTRHVQYGVVKTGATFRYMQPIHRWSLPWQSVVFFFVFFWCGKKLAKVNNSAFTLGNSRMQHGPFIHGGVFQQRLEAGKTGVPKASSLDMDIWKKRFMWIGCFWGPGGNRPGRQ